VLIRTRRRPVIGVTGKEIKVNVAKICALGEMFQENVQQCVAYVVQTMTTSCSKLTVERNNHVPGLRKNLT